MYDFYVKADGVCSVNFVSEGFKNESFQLKLQKSITSYWSS